MAKRMFRALHPWPVDAEAFGLSARLYPFDNVAEFKTLFKPSRFNTRELQFLKRILERPSSVFIDVGANAGMFSLFAAANSGPNATIIAIEPHPELFKRLTYNLSDLLVSRSAGAYKGPKIQLLEMALGSKTGTTTLRTNDNDLGAGQIVEDGGQGHQVSIGPLHQVLWDLGIHSIDALKIDVEGYEDRVLEPFYHFAPAPLWPRAVIIEHISRDQWAYDCITQCEARGYTVLFKTRSNTILLRGSPTVKAH
ncbi:MAG: FkbM family methyltransferase [Alphaproteobacteria bacterium]